MNLIAFRDWLNLVEEKGLELPMIEAHHVGHVATRDLLEAIWDHELSNELDQLIGKARNVHRKDHIFRWDPGVSDGVKHAMGQPGKIGPPDLSLEAQLLEGHRLMMILMEYGQKRVHLWQRPWKQAVYEDGFPVEFRVFAREGQIQGVSNYYPQRDLPEHYHEAATRAAELAKPVLAHQPDFSMDFLLDPDGKLWWLEGGPAHHAEPNPGGAHPCCFPPGKIKGIQLVCHPKAPKP